MVLIAILKFKQCMITYKNNYKPEYDSNFSNRLYYSNDLINNIPSSNDINVLLDDIDSQTIDNKEKISIKYPLAIKSLVFSDVSNTINTLKVFNNNSLNMYTIW